MARNGSDRGDEWGRALAIYLRDHHAAARAGTRIARRAATGVSRDLEGVGELAQVADQVEEDFGTLERVMQAEGVSPDVVKDSLATILESLGRLKPNGRLRGRARLSDVIELETLVVGITGKAALWKSLAVAAKRADQDFEALIDRAHSQREVVARLRDEASSRAFSARD